VEVEVVRPARLKCAALLFATWALSALLFAAAPARADAVEDQALICMQPSTDTETRIMMCSLAIMSGRWSGKALAALYFHRGRAYADRKEHSRAIQDFDKAIALSPTFEDAKRARQRSMAAASPPPAPAAQAQADGLIRCESFDGERKSCGTNLNGVAVLVRQLSDTSCREAVTWGLKNGSIWVDRGCRGLFRMQRNAPRTGLDLSDVTLHAKACVSSKVHTDAFGGDMGLEFCTSAISSGRWSGKDLAVLHYARGVRYFQQRRYAAAIPDFDQAIRLNPAFAQAYTGRCAANAATGKPDRAIADCDQALQLDPKDAQARELRARLSR
jgi:tetratricopeptide (TPR) repeat protein